MPKLATPIAVAAIAWLCLSAGPASAASQVLGLVASNGLPTPLHCQDGVCTGHFSAFCLQEQRPAPSADSDYGLAPGGALILVARLADGRDLRLPAGHLLTIRTRIGFTSVRMSLPESVLNSLGAVSAAVEVAPMTSILPRAVAGDPDPQSPQEIDLATGPMRRAAQQPFEAAGAASDAARLTSLLINLIPEEEPQTPAGRDALWQRTLALAAAGRAVAPAGIEASQRIYSDCETALASKSSFSLRSCLELRHADLMAQTNRDFWGSTGGS
jgi:hypothetical protein